MKSIFFLLVTIVLRLNLFAQQTKTEIVYFDYNKYNLTEEAKSTLDAFYNSIQTKDFSKITVIGHTDSDGSEAYNYILSKNRSKAVFDYLHSIGVNIDIIQMKFYGENIPLTKNDNEQAKQKNRRVEIVLEKENRSDNLIFEKQAQLFTIPSNKDTTLYCKEGTIINIKANSFVFENIDQPVNSEINFSVTEYYTISDIILSDLSTSSDGQLLETAGMVNIRAISNNQPLNLMKGKNIEINFPARKKENDMKLFSGFWETNNNINWIPQSEANKDSQQVYTFVDKRPTFKGGDKKLLEYLSQTIKYPHRAKELEVQGTVHVTFVIDKTGAVKEPKILKGVTKELNLAALDAIKKMPNWIPGKNNGQNVNVQFTLPVHFKLGDTSLVGDGTFKERFEKYYTDTTIHNTKPADIAYYVLSATALGWNNCDRFLKINPKINFVVKLENGVETIKIIFDRYNSVMDAKTVNGKFIFEGVPLGEKITIVAIKRIDNKQYLSIKETQTSTKVEQEFIFQPVTMETLKNALKKLDKLI